MADELSSRVLHYRFGAQRVLSRASRCIARHKARLNHTLIRFTRKQHLRCL